MDKPKFAYVTYIDTTPEKLWEALTKGEFTRQYWFDSSIESDWKIGSPVIFRRNGNIGAKQTVLKCEPPRLLSYTWDSPCNQETHDEPPSRVTFEIEPLVAKGGAASVRLMVTHDQFPPNSRVYPGISKGWPAVISNLKTFLETGRPMVIPLDKC
jgi:uncharacterized protein YndB with AHSA1/START domain